MKAEADKATEVLALLWSIVVYYSANKKFSAFKFKKKTSGLWEVIMPAGKLFSPQLGAADTGGMN